MRVPKRLESDSRFRALTPQQQRFLRHYFETRDAQAAAFAAFKVKSSNSARAMAHKMLTHSLVGRLITEFENQDIITDKEILAELSAAARQEENFSAKVQALRILAEMRGWIGRGASKESDSHELSKEDISRLAEAVKDA